ncbi:MAG: diguanylate cyclase domain-containing protein, partial [Microthrixaceae bacterium]
DRRRDDPEAMIVAQLRVAHAGGGHRWVELRARPFVDERGVVDGNAVSLRRVDGEVAARQELERRARFDEVTGLMNRVEVLERLEQLPRRVRRSGTEIAVMFCDVDSLKSVNDALGHRVGDLLLRTVADRVVASVRADDLVARIGGDELLVVLDGVHDLAQAVEVAEKVRAAVARPVELEGRELSPTLSIGVAIARSGDGTDELVARADAAMYRAKRAGRDRVATASV